MGPDAYYSLSYLTSFPTTHLLKERRALLLWSHFTGGVKNQAKYKGKGCVLKALQLATSASSARGL